MGIKTQSQAQTFAPETGSSVVGSAGPGASAGQRDSMAQSGASGAGAIAQVLPHLESGPIGRFAADIALTVQRLGGDSRMVSAGGRFAQEVQRASVLHENIDLEAKGPFGFGGAGARLNTLLDGWNCRLIHSHGANSAQVVKKAIGTRPIHHVASLYRLPDNDKATDTASRALLQADKVIVASDFIKKLLVSGNPETADRITVIPPGMAINAVHPSVVTAARLSRLVRKIDISTDAPIILFPAAIDASAGHSVLLNALSEMSDAPWVCLFATIGPGNRKVRSQIQAQIEKFGLQSRVHFVDNCDDPATLYKLASVVISSVMGNLAFDYAAAEAQSAGKLVLVPNSGASQDQVSAGDDGAIFEAGDAETLNMALRWSLSLAPDIRAEIEHAATTRAYKTYKREEAIKRVFSVYDTLLT